MLIFLNQCKHWGYRIRDMEVKSSWWVHSTLQLHEIKLKYILLNYLQSYKFKCTFHIEFPRRILEFSLIHLVTKSRRLNEIVHKIQIIFEIKISQCWVLCAISFNLSLLVTRCIRKDSNSFKEVQYGMYIWICKIARHYFYEMYLTLFLMQIQS